MRPIKPFLKRIWPFMFLDIFIIVGVLFLSFLSYYGFTEAINHIIPILIYIGSVTVVSISFYYVLDVYKIIIREVGLIEYLKIFIITFIIQILGVVILIFIKELPGAGRFFWGWILSVLVISLLVPATRFLYVSVALIKGIRRGKRKVRTLIIGAGVTAKFVVDNFRSDKNCNNDIIAFIDDDPNKIGGVFANLPVKGPISDAQKIINFHNIEEVIIAISDLKKERLAEILSILNECPVRVKRVPLLSEMQGPNDIRVIDVDLDDLLSRTPIQLDNHLINQMLGGKVVMVTGAGGSIGSELVKQIFDCKPKRLILFDIYENSTYDIQQFLKMRILSEGIRGVDVVTLIGSTYNEKRVDQIVSNYKPDYIYHAAAYKHVPLMEDSPAEAIRTNVIGTYNVCKAADKYSVKKVVLVSTDKAVRPTNVMGATKRFAETIIQYFANKSKNTKYAAVRFGNVLGSNGSVIPLFKKQIEAGGPVTVTHKDIIRYFMTIPEAVSLILQCGLFAEGGEIFVLDMGKPVKIYDLAVKMIRQAGLVPNKDIMILETGLRPGEKLFEELLIDKTTQNKTSNSKIFVEKSTNINEQIEKDVEMAKTAFNIDDSKDVKQLLAKLVSTYKITNN